MSQRIAQTLKEVPRNFLPSSISFDSEFYTNIDEVRSNGIPKYIELKNLIDRNENLKILFAGHTGTGKSTELNRLALEIESHYEVIKFSIKETNDPLAIQYEDLLVASINKILEHIKNKNIELEIDDKVLKKFFDWITKIDVVKELVESTEIATTAEVGTEVKFPFIASIFAKLSSKLKLSGQEKVTYRQVIDKNITQLLSISQELFCDIEKIFKKKIVLIIEDLDKIDTQKSKEIFIDNHMIFSEIPLTIIYTVPIFLMHSSDMSSLDGNVFHCVTLPMIKTREQDNYNTKYSKGINKITDLIAKRMDLNLFQHDEDDNLLEYLIFKSGGVLRDVFQVIVKSSESATYNKREKINKDDILYYLNERKNFYYRAISGASQRDISPHELIDKLKEMHKDNITKPSAVDNIILEALRLQILIEYNGTTWYGIHPLVIEHIEEQ